MSEYKKPKVKQVSQNVHLVTFAGNKKLYLVGTAHISAESVALVEETINEYKPDTICVELDEQRHKSLTQRNKYANIDIVQIIKKKQLFFFIGQFIMSTFQKKMSEKTGSKPGQEFQRAIELADGCGAKLVLADRNLGITLKRAWRKTRFRDKIKLFGSLLFGKSEELEEFNIEDMKTSDAIDAMVSGFAEELPDAKEVLIDERDTFLACEVQNNLGKTTVAVVGAGHVPGMLRKFEKELAPAVKEEISVVPPPSKIGKIIPWLIPAVVVGLVAWGFMSGNRDVAQDVVVYWVLANGILTAIGCLLAFGHPLTVLAGFVAAPITSLNPTIGAGFVTAFVQTVLVKPRVKDIEQIQGKTLKFRNWWSNRVTKVFLVFLLSSVGSSIGTFVALPALTKLFSGEANTLFGWISTIL